MAFTKINAAGIGTTETVTVDGLTVINDGSFGGNLTVSGVLTYEDVTNVDSVGLITARNGIVVGSGITLSKDGDGFFTGIVTATSFSGSGANLTGIDTDLVSDTTPQLGGDLDTNDNAIRCSDSNGTNNQITFGDSNDLQIRHQSNSSYIINSTGNLNIGSNNEVRIKGGSDVAEMMIKCVDNGTVELYHDGTKKFETISTGVVITGSDDGDGGAKGDFKFFQTDGTLKIMFDASTSQFEFLDNSKASFGNDDDLKIYHDSNNSAINHNGTGDFYIQSNNNIYIRNIGGDNYISAIEDGAVELYHNGTKMIETISTGTSIPDGKFAKFGDGNDMTMGHNTYNYITYTGADLLITGDATNQIKLMPKSDEAAIICKPNAETALYYNGSLKAQTTSTGMQTVESVKMKYSSNGVNIKQVFEQGVGNTGTCTAQVPECVGGGTVTITCMHNGNTSITTTKMFPIMIQGAGTANLGSEIFSINANSNASFNTSAATRGVTVTNNAGAHAKIRITFDITANIAVD